VNLTEGEIRHLVSYARGKFEAERYPLAPSLRSAREVLAKVDPTPIARCASGIKKSLLFFLSVVIGSMGGAAFALAQTFSPSAFDGTYAGTASFTHQVAIYKANALAACAPATPISMRIGNGQVAIFSPAIRNPNRNIVFRGTIAPTGEVVASFSPSRPPEAGQGSFGGGYAFGFTVRGTVRGGAFTGEIMKFRCWYGVQMTRQ
jgi:hypothetical protein